MKYSTFILLVSAIWLMFACASKEDRDETKVTIPPVSELKSAVGIRAFSVKEASTDDAKDIATIQKGERFTVLGDTASIKTADNKRIKLVKIQLANGKEGWLNESAVAVGAVAATLIKDAPVYGRPHMLIPTNQVFKRMDFVAATISKEDGWAQVAGRSSSSNGYISGWILSENITTSAKDVGVSILYARAMSFDNKAQQKVELKKILDNPDLSSSLFYPVVVKSAQ